MKPTQIKLLTIAALMLPLVAPVATQAETAAAPEKKTEVVKEVKAPATPELKDPVATVDGSPISRADLEKKFELLVASTGRGADALTPEQKMEGYRAVLENMIVDKLLTEKAKDIAVTDEDVDKQLKEIRAQFESEEKMSEEIKKTGMSMDELKVTLRNSMRQQKWVESQIAEKTKVAEADTKKFYDENPTAFKVPERVRASHILIMTPQDATPEVVAEKEKAIKAVAARLKKGESFEVVAKEVSEDPGSKASGGDLNFFTKDAMVPEFSEAAFKLKKGEVSAPVKSNFGYHIIKVTDREAARDVPYSEAKEKITGYMEGQKKQEAMGTLVRSVRSSAKVESTLPEAPKKAAGAMMPPTTPGNP